MLLPTPTVTTVLVPGALLPLRVASGLAEAMRAPELARWLADARKVEDCTAAAGATGAAHWSWIVRQFRLASEPPVTAPYAWRALCAADPLPRETTVALCEPMHLAFQRDRYVLAGLDDVPLSGADADALVALANEALRATPPFDALPGVRICRAAGHWFLLGAPAQESMPPLEAVLGAPAHDHVHPGARERHWRALHNSIQMLWHASPVNTEREARGAQPVNDLWIHGAGAWQDLQSAPFARLDAPRATALAATLQGYLDAAAPAGTAAESGAGARGPVRAAEGVLLLREDLWSAFARQAWPAWLAALEGLDAALAAARALALAQGGADLHLVLAGRSRVRSLVLPLRPPAWRSLWPGARDARRILPRFLGIEPEALEAEGAG